MKHEDVKMDKAVVRKAIHAHERGKHPGQSLTKLRAGGKTNSDMKKYGRGMAKVMNQRKPMRGSSGPR
jgi:hypothetical protein